MNYVQKSGSYGFIYYTLMKLRLSPSGRRAVVGAGQMKRVLAVFWCHLSLNAKSLGFSRFFGCDLFVVEEYFSCFQLLSKGGTKDFFQGGFSFTQNLFDSLKYICIIFTVNVISVKS